MSLSRAAITIRRRWVAALRSGKYQQGTGQLRDGSGYCCLGVLCEIVRPGALGDSVSVARDRLPPEIASVAELDDSAQTLFADLNDGSKSFSHETGLGRSFENELHTFLEIADTIELLTLAGE